MAGALVLSTCPLPAHCSYSSCHLLFRGELRRFAVPRVRLTSVGVCARAGGNDKLFVPRLHHDLQK